MRSRELDRGAATPWQTLADVPEGVHPFFHEEFARIEDGLLEIAARPVEELVADDWLRLKRLGLGDADIAAAAGATEDAVRARRRDCGVRPVFRRVDSCAGEVEAASNYYYSTWGEAEEAAPTGHKPRVVILGSGPNRIGQGVEFDYCCVHAVATFRELGYEAVMVNCNPETVSTDYDTSDRLYFEPLDVESVLAVCDRERPEGVVIQFGGADAAEARTRDRGGGLHDHRHAVRRGRPRRGPRALRRPAPRARRCARPRGRWRRRATTRCASRTRSATRC